MRTVAFYLPQFHAIPENDEWWGEGFTEWSNVRRAVPQFAGHDHPRRVGDLGEYDLTDSSVHQAQTDLAREAGIDAFCMYFYWFDGRRLLERPLELWRRDPTLMPYCLSWANEAWTRRWDGKTRDVLMGQTYEPGFADALFNELASHFEADHYLRMDGKPVLVVHRADIVPDAAGFAARLRELAVAAGHPGLYLVAAETKPGMDPRPLGFDALAEFPPVGANTMRTAMLRPLAGVSNQFRGRLMSYDRVVTFFQGRRVPRSYVRHRGVMPSWDNTARRMSRSTVYVGSTPRKFAAWIESAKHRERDDRGSAGLVFVNAWNEWAEGAYLEPDATNGRGYLDAASGKHGAAADLRSHQFQTVWGAPQLRSIGLACAGSVLSLYRRMRKRPRWKD